LLNIIHLKEETPTRAFLLLYKTGSLFVIMDLIIELVGAIVSLIHFVLAGGFVKRINGNLFSIET